MSLEINADKQIITSTSPSIIGTTNLTLKAGSGSDEKEVLRLLILLLVATTGIVYYVLFLYIGIMPTKHPTVVILGVLRVNFLLHTSW